MTSDQVEADAMTAKADWVRSKRLPMRWNIL
jgi:hypothetical protein